MAVVFQDVTGIANGNAATAAITAQAHSSGDLLISEVFLTAADKTLSVSSGWTIAFQQNLAGGLATYGIAWRVANGTANDNITWSWDGTSANRQGNIWRYTGHYAASPIGNIRGLLRAAGTTAGVTAVLASAAASYMASWNSTYLSNQTVPTPTNYTLRNDFSSATFSERFTSRDLTNVGDSSGDTTVTVTSAKTASMLIEIRSQAPPAASSKVRATVIIR